MVRESSAVKWEPRNQSIFAQIADEIKRQSIKRLGQTSFCTAAEIPAQVTDSERKLGIVSRGGIDALQMFFLWTKL